MLQTVEGLEISLCCPVEAETACCSAATTAQRTEELLTSGQTEEEPTVPRAGPNCSRGPRCQKPKGARGT